MTWNDPKDSVPVNEETLSVPVRTFIQEYVARSGNANWISDCVNGKQLCTSLLGKNIIMTFPVRTLCTIPLLETTNPIEFLDNSKNKTYSEKN
jgi:hypothetical protein